MGPTPDRGEERSVLMKVRASAEPDRPAASPQEETEQSSNTGRSHPRPTLLVLGLLLPLGVIVALALWAIDGGPPALDLAAMQAVHAWAGPRMDTAVLWISHLGYSHGVVPFDVLLVLTLLMRRHWREGAFSLAALAGALWLNGELKALFARPRPDLWEPLWRYSGNSFPSGHAAATATLTAVLALLTWNTRWRVPVLSVMVPFTLLVGLSRPYMGVHYPSDVLAGWAFGCAWAVACYLVAFHRRDPWQSRLAGRR